MNKLATLRLLLIAFVLVYVYAMSTSGLSPDAPRQALDYVAWAREQPRTTSPLWGMLCLFGHVADIVGIVLLFVRKKMGVYFMIAGFLSCLGTGSGLPFLETSFSALLMALVNILWGSIITLVFSNPRELFPKSAEA